MVGSTPTSGSEAAAAPFWRALAQSVAARFTCKEVRQKAIGEVTATRWATLTRSTSGKKSAFLASTRRGNPSIIRRSEAA
jgi:phosphopantetheinyl transferase (holo-ACP synthase)